MDQLLNTNFENPRECVLLQELAKITPYVCSEVIFDGLQFMLNRIFLEKKKIKNICCIFNYTSFGIFCVRISKLHEPH